jgi:peroxiredoxin
LELRTIQGKAVRLPDADAPWTHLQFRRYAGCPICNLHVRSLARSAGELKARGIREVIVFHSSAEAMLPYQGDLPFDVIADPGKDLYKRFGVETSWRAFVNFGSLVAAIKGMSVAKPTTLAENGRLGLPADVLIGRDGRVAAAKYGTTADDQWSVAELLSLAGPR